MKTKLLFPLLLIFISHLASAQVYTQYFDGADTIYNNSVYQRSLRIIIENDSTNIWQIGKPQKNIFDSAATSPNALLTDTVNFYPSNNISRFQFTIVPNGTWGILAIQWKQKLDMDAGQDGGIIEFSVDSGLTWQNAFNNPHVYNFYGYQAGNADTLSSGEAAFSGQDSVWRDIWLCYDMNWLSWNDSIMMRFTFASDSNNNNREGWMIDNMMVHATFIHTVDETKQEKYLKVHPNPASDIIHIETKKLQHFHIIEQMLLINAAGQTVGEWNYIPTKFFIDARKYSNGLYYLKVKTNVRSETIPVIINHN